MPRSLAQSQYLAELQSDFYIATQYNILNYGQRPGQARMNALREVAPDLYEIVTGTDADCFHQDAKIGAFESVTGLHGA
jgi:hypothetical protein